jgi:hypothetical protein
MTFSRRKSRRQKTPEAYENGTRPVQRHDDEIYRPDREKVHAFIETMSDPGDRVPSRGRDCYAAIPTITIT